MNNEFSSLEDYLQLRKSYQLEAPEFFNFGLNVVDQLAEDRPEATALLWSGQNTERTVKFGEMSVRSNQVAHALHALDIKPGERVLVILPTIVEWWESIVGLCKADIIAIPGTNLLTPHDITYRIKAAGITAVITDEIGADKLDSITEDIDDVKHKILVGSEPRPGWDGYRELVDAASREPRPIQTESDGPSLIYFTSGTTGFPKMVLHTHASYGLGHEITGRFWLGLCPDDLHWNVSDTGWAKTAYAAIFGPWLQGSGVFVRHRPGKFFPPDVLEQTERHPITSLCGAPTMYRMLVQEPALETWQPEALRQCLAAGEPLNPAVWEKWKAATGIGIREGYGQSESTILCASLPGLEIRPGSMGMPPPGIELAVLDPDDNPLPPGQAGEIAVRVKPNRPLGLFKEYWQNPTATAKCYRGDWYLTGDCAEIDEDGYFWFVSRTDDIITSAGYRIGPFEVENALMQHPSVAEVAVIGKPDSDRTEIVKAFVVLANGFEASDNLKAELQEHVKSATAPYKYPREIEFLDELPKTVTGKVRRVALRERESA